MANFPLCVNGKVASPKGTSCYDFAHVTDSKIYLAEIPPKTMLQELVDTVISINLQQGGSNALDAKLDTVISSLDVASENNDVAASKSLYAFINAVEA